MSRTLSGVLGLLLLAAPVAADPRPQEGQKLPPLTLEDPQGGKHESAALVAGGPFVMVFVSAEQRLSLRLLNDLAHELRGVEKARALLVFSGEEVKGEGLDRAQQMQGEGPFQVLMDPDRSAYAALQTVALPSAYVVDKEGVVVRVHRGYTNSMAQQLVEGLRVALGLISEQQASGNGKTEEVTLEEKRRLRQLQLVEHCVQNNQLDAALRMLDGMLQQSPKDPEATARRALLLQRMQSLDALDALRAAHRLSPKDVRVTVALAAELITRGQLEEAEPLVRAGIESPRPERAYFLLGELRAKAGDWKAAAEAYRESAKRQLEHAK